jgi:pimeloyl-ACP methyl ester carboxylesterase
MRGRAASTRISFMKNGFVLIITLTLVSAAAVAQAAAQTRAQVPAPADVKPGSITCEECPYPFPSSYLPLTLYGQDVRIAYMDVAPQGAANGHTVMIFHGHNFAGFYFGNIIDALRAAGFRVIVVDQIGYGRSSKPIMPYSLNDMARNSHAILESLKIDKAMVVGHSMGGMLAARFASLYPTVTERLVIYNPIGLVDTRHGRAPGSVDAQYKNALGATYQSVKAGLMRYVAHNPAKWNDEFEKYARIRYAWTLGADWPRLAMVQTLTGSLISGDPVVYDWARIQAPTLAFGGAEDVLPGSAQLFQERMKVLADTVPNGNGKLLLLPGLGHVPHLEAPDRTIPPLVAFLKEGAK